MQRMSFFTGAQQARQEGRARGDDRRAGRGGEQQPAGESLLWISAIYRCPRRESAGAAGTGAGL